ncbi:hypothetical protein [Streptomyces sp. NBC_01240]|uniref:hypothetical protein n=1 Tax=Streptomyces sp. NBC_01240 TaxID=2903793 RepID=UPI002E1243A9|nr:hypothetical protein OG466_00970 [Streptomyces sp. NBC_01240]
MSTIKGKLHYKRRSKAERTINRLKNFRAVATRYDKRAYVFDGTVDSGAQFSAAA